MLFNKARWLFLIAGFFLFGVFINPVWAKPNSNVECYIEGQLCIPVAPKRSDYNKDELLLMMGKGASKSLYTSILNKFGLGEKASLSLDSLGLDIKIAKTKGQDPLELSERINLIYESIEASTNNHYKLETTVSELIDKDDYPKSLTGAQQALQYSKGTGVLIGMVDGPVDISHSSFRGRVEQTSLVEVKSRSMANLLHGTAVAGVLMSDNAQIGIAPEARLLSVVAFEKTDKSSFSSNSALIAQAIDYAINKKVEVLNLSFSGGYDALVERVIKKAIAKGIIVVASCGNDASDKPRYPAAISGVIAVTAVDHLKNSYSKANRGEYIDVAAPGVGVLTTGPGERYLLSSGTSLAAANVSGSLALLIAKKKNIDRDLLSYTATDLGEPGRDASYGDGLINVLSALESIIR